MILRFIRSLFAWRLVKGEGVWLYEENEVTGRRRAERCNHFGHSPLDWDWLLAGQGMPTVDGIEAWRSAERGSLPDGRYWT